MLPRTRLLPHWCRLGARARVRLGETDGEPVEPSGVGCAGRCHVFREESPRCRPFGVCGKQHETPGVHCEEQPRSGGGCAWRSTASISRFDWLSGRRKTKRSSSLGSSESARSTISLWATRRRENSSSCSGISFPHLFRLASNEISAGATALAMTVRVARSWYVISAMPARLESPPRPSVYSVAHCPSSRPPCLHEFWP